MADKRTIALKETVPGQIFEGYCVIRKRELRQKRQGEPYLWLEVGDHSGRLQGKIWKQGRMHYDQIKIGMVVKIKARVERYRGHRDLRIDHLRPALPQEYGDSLNFLPRPQKDIKLMQSELKAQLESIEDVFLQELLGNIFADHETYRKFCNAPAGKLWHHNRRCGALEHTLSLLALTDTLAGQYPLLKTDLLKSGIMLYNIAGTGLFNADGFYDYNDEGRLMGPAVCATLIIAEESRRISGFPVELLRELLHIVNSPRESGNRQTGGGEVHQLPKPAAAVTLEALAFQKMLLLDTMMDAVCRIIRSDILPGSDWSKYIPSLDRLIYYRNKPDQEEGNNKQALMKLNLKLNQSNNNRPGH